MGIEVVPYEPRFEPAVRRFNRRLSGSPEHESFALPRSADPPNSEGKTKTRHYLGVDDSEEVRGGFVLHRHRGHAGGREIEIFNLQAPISEAVVDSRYRMVGPLMLRSAVRQWPYIYAVGMGGTDQPLPRLLDALGWRVSEVPFFYWAPKPVRAAVEFLRAGAWPLPSWLGDAADLTGVDRLARRLFFRPTVDHVSLTADAIDEWAEWSDVVWDDAKTNLGFALVRDASSLAQLYPVDGRTLNYRLHEGDDVVGWISLLDTQMKNHAYFGDLKVGTLLDGLTLQGYEGPATQIAQRILTDRGVDLVVTNQIHRNWVTSMHESGFKQRSSNYLLGLSPDLKGVSADQCRGSPSIHVTRGDGDGRMHL